MNRTMMGAECSKFTNGFANKRQHRLFYFLVACAFALAFSPAIYGQSTGNISGTVLDQSGSSIVGATVTATSQVPDSHKGLATGLVTTSQRVAVSVGIPLLGTFRAIRADLLAGNHLALAADVL